MATACTSLDARGGVRLSEFRGLELVRWIAGGGDRRVGKYGKVFDALEGAGKSLLRKTDDLAEEGAEKAAKKVDMVGSAANLRKELLKAGDKAEPGDHAAHLVPRDTGSRVANTPAAREARDKLEDLGIPVDHADNGKFLPGGQAAADARGVATHGSTHRKEFYDALNERLQEAETPEQAQAVLRSIKDKLGNGRWP
jgi:hypothetical protein